MTWVFVLILFKRQIPKWLREKTVKIVVPEELVGTAEKYVK